MNNTSIKIKEQAYEKEELYLSKYATKSNQTKGRVKDEEECPMRTDFQRDKIEFYILKRLFV